MLNIMFKMIFRGWAKNKIYFIISMLSLIIGLTCSVLLIGFISSEYEIAYSVKDSDQWYLLQQQEVHYVNSVVMENGGGVGSRVVAIREHFPEVEEYCVFHQNAYSFQKGAEFHTMIGCYEVTANFPDIFHPVVLAGDLKGALTDPRGMAVTRSFALKNWGKENPVGEELNLVSLEAMFGAGGQAGRPVRIMAVIDDRMPGFFEYEVLLGLPEAEIALGKRDWKSTYYSFLKLNPKISAREFEKQLNEDKVYRGRYQVSIVQKLLPLNKIYFSSASRGLLKSRDITLLYVAVGVALIILIIACFNYINISMTKSMQRLRNVSQQMVFGATSFRMKMQLLLETALHVFIAMCIALLLIWYILPVFNRFVRADLHFADLFTGFSWWVMLLVIAGIIVGPSLYIFSRMEKNSLSGLKNGIFQRGKLVTGMVVFQFVISVVLILVVLCIRQQMNYIGHVRPGSDQIFQVTEPEFLRGEYAEQFKEQLLSIPEISDRTFTLISGGPAILSEGTSVGIVDADDRYIPFYGIEILQGKGFDARTGPEDILVNEAFVKTRGLEDPVGYELELNGKRRIIGVIRDYVSGSFTRQISPLIVRYNNKPNRMNGIIIIKIVPGTEKQVRQKMRELARKIYNEDRFLSMTSMNDVYLSMHKEEVKVMQIVGLFTWISLFLTGMGLFGLSWYSVEIRLKEMGIRKINGATRTELLWEICRRFVNWIIIALVIGIPLALFVVQQWRMQFVYKVDLGVWVFVQTILIIFAVGFLTVIGQAWKAAGMNPVRIIKAE